MVFYEVWVRSNHYHGSEPLTYAANENIKPGQIVVVPLRHETVIGIVFKKTAKPKVKTKLIQAISDLPTLPIEILQLMKWMKEYYPSSIGTITQLFIPPNIIKHQNQLYSNYLNRRPSTIPDLSEDQKMAINSMQNYDTYLLHGRTGSGKTRIYQELAIQEISKQKSVLLLTPEISLTTQLEDDFKHIFGNSVVLLHSTLTPKQRAERWVQLLSSKSPKIVIGPRSIIFSPLSNIGLIVIDEEHEPSYKQEQAPYYLTSRVAAKLRSIHVAKLILGSATPLVTDYYLARNREKPIIRLDKLARNNNTKLETIVVDSHDRSLFPRSNYISQPLTNSIETAIGRGEQALLYLNRRGTARAIVCTVCDYQAKCPRCDLPLTYHGDSHLLRCHLCGFTSSAPISCPECHNPTIKYLSIGTKAVVSEAERLFPDAKIQRFDSDSSKAERLEQHYSDIKNGSVDIIVGTQLLAKGLDLPKLSVVGVLLADTSLQLPDYTANERTFQLLSQVVGRVGRGHIDGKAIIQTYQPQSPALNAALKDDWENFYKKEIKERQLFLFPPFTHLLKLTVSRANSKSAQKAASIIASNLPKDVRVEGPAPAFHERG